ncbi:MAG TPA: YggT family protein [Acidimicrobiales bacterium]|jgi:YggT family protein|nr:YggT family protein [Acidimicrobiales bacterium]
MSRLIGYLLEIYVLVLIAYSLLSWFQPAYDSPVRKIQKGLAAVCDPVLNLVRRVLPTARIGTVGLDLSVLVVILVIQVIILPLVLG